MLKNSLIIVAGLLTTQAFAGTDTFHMDQGTLSGNNTGNTLTLNNVGDDNIDLIVKGFADTGSNDTIEAGRIVFYGDDIGLINQEANGGDSGTPEHSIDSYNAYDAVLLEFSEEVDLTRFDIGWAWDYSDSNNYADISVVAYTGQDGGNNNNGNIAGQSWAGILGQGWDVIGNYGNVAQDGYQNVTTDVTSKFWLIGAYNSTFYGSSAYNDSGLGSGNDGFKLEKVKTSYTKTEKPPGVPEPGMFALFALGLLSLAKVRKGNNIKL